MSENGALNDLAERKRLLLLESGLHRAMLKAECAKARSQAQRLKSGFGVGRFFTNWIGNSFLRSDEAAAPGSNRMLSWISIGLASWRLINTILSVRKSSRKESAQPESSTKQR